MPGSLFRNVNARELVDGGLDALLPAVLAYVFLVSTWGLGDTAFVLLAAVIVYGARNLLRGGGEKAVGPADVALLFVVVVELASFHFSVYPANSLFSVAETMTLVLLYYLVRDSLTTDYQRALTYAFATLFGACLSVLAIYHFQVQYRRLSALGFADVSQLRHTITLLNPTGTPLGEWATIFLVLLPFPLILLIRYRSRRAARWGLTVVTAGLVVTALLTFSRGVYAAVAVFFVSSALLLCLNGILSKKAVLKFGLALGVLVAAALAPLHRPVATTLSVFGTASQVRSFEGRTRVWGAALEMAARSPLVGGGGYNFPLLYNARRSQHTEAPFVGRPFNLALQVLVEKGAAGLLAYGFLLSVFLVSSRRAMKLLPTPQEKGAAALFAASWLAVLVRDLSYSSVFTNKGALLLLCLMFALNTRSPKPDAAAGGRLARSRTLKPVLITLLACALFVPSVWKRRNVDSSLNHFKAFKTHLSRGEFDRAGEALNLAEALSPDNSNYLAHRALLKYQKVCGVPRAEPCEDGPSLTPEDEGELRAAASLYQSALGLNPYDDVYHHNLGRLYWMLREEGRAVHHLRRAVTLDPGSAVYRVSLGLLLERVGRAGEAAGEYAAALEVSPGLLDSGFFRDLAGRDPELARLALSRSTRELEASARLRPTPLAKARLGRLYLESGYRDEAQEMLAGAVAELPGLSRPWSHLGRLRGERGDSTGMQRAYERALFLDRGDMHTLAGLGDQSLREGLTERAAFYYREALERNGSPTSEHAKRVSRLYHWQTSVGNDLIPQDLLSYADASFDGPGLCRKLRALSEELEEEELTVWVEARCATVNYAKESTRYEN